MNVELAVSGTGSEIKESSLKLYKATTDSTGMIVNGIEEDSEVVLAKNFTMSKNIVVDPFELCDQSGMYRLILYLKDSVGRTKQIKKDVEVVYQLPPPDEASLSQSKGGTAVLTWRFSYNAQHKIKLGSFIGRFGNSGEWEEIVSPRDDGKLPFAGSAEIEVPDEEGIWDLNLKSVDSKGNEGGEFSVKCVVDKTAPSVNLSSCIQGHLKGNVTDDNFKEWKLYAKEKSAAEYGEEAIKSGKHDTDEHNNEITFVDFTKEPFETGGEYTLKIIAEDKAGNKGEGTLDVTVPSDGTAARIIEAGIQIDKGDRPEDVTGFIIPADQQELKLKDNAGTAEWYVAGSKTSPQLKDADGNSTIGEDTWQEILAVKKELTSERKYSVDVIENGEKKSVSYTSSQISGSTGTKEISFTNNVVSFRIKAQPGVATYKVRAETASGSGSYVTVQPDTTYYVSDITDSAAYTRVFTVKATAQSGKNLNDSSLTIYADTMQPEFFLYSNIEIYAAGNLTVEDKINFKSYLKWDIPDSLPDNISYEVYRGDKHDFDYETEGTLIASDLKTGYFALINAWSGKDLYYKVCAVKKHTDGSLLYRSTFSEECAGRAADLNESLKHLGMKDYWEFAEFDTPNGSGYIEKSSGNFLYQQKDAELPNEGFDVEFTRTYNSKSSIRGNLGTGWSHEYDIELLDISEDDALKFTHVILKDGNGTIYHFTRGKEEEQFISSFGSHVNLTAETKEKEKTVKVSANSEDTTVTLRYQFVLHTKDGIKYYFNSGGQLILMEENNGSFVIFEHDAKKGVLSAMRTNNDITAQFIYCDGTDGTDPLTVKEVRLPDGSRVEYEYTKPAFTSEQLLTKVSEVSGSERIEYEYEYDKPLLSTQPRNLTVIKDAENKNKYEIKYDFENDQVKEAVYPNGEKFTFEYDENGRYTVTKKYSGGEAVLAEKDFFDVISGECEKSIRGIDDETVLTASGQEGLDITTYEYIDNQMVSSSQTAEYYAIDDNGYVVKQNGIKTNKTSYSGDNPVKETEDDGTVSEYTYYTEEDGENLDEQIKTVKETNADGRMTGYTKYSYDSLGNVTETIEYVEGTKTVNTYYTEGVFKGELKSMTESLIKVSDTYEILSESVQSRSVYTYAYDTRDGKDVKTESCSQTIYKADGSEDTVVSGNIYDMMGRLLEETDSRGYKTINAYDGFGRVTATTYKYSDSNQLKQSTSKEYDKNGNVTHEVLEDGIEKSYTYNNMGQVTSVTVRKGDGQEETVNTTYRYQDVEIYQGKGNDTVTVKNAYVTKETYADGTIVSETYEDHKGNTVRSYQGGLYTDMTYSIQGDMLTKWTMGQTISADEGLLELYIYDDNGNLTYTITDPDYIAAAGTTGYHLRADAADDNGNIVQGSIVSSSTYDADGNAVTQTDALGNTTGYQYDKEGNLLSVTLPDATEYEYQYDVMDSSGDSKTTKDIVIEPREIWQDGVKVNTTSRSVVTKDSADRTVKVEDLGTSETDGTSISTAYEYDSRDNLTKSIDKKGNYREYSYDSRDRLTTVEYYERRNDSTVKTLKTAYTYDDADNMTSMTDMDIKEGQEEIYRYTAYGYDDFNRLISVSECDTDSMPSDTVINANKIIYSYDGKDRLVSISYPDAALGVTGLEFIYNIHGWLTEVKAEGTNVFSRTIREYTYTADGKVDEITDYTDFQSGLTGTSRWLKRSYGYDKLNRTVSIEYTDNMSSGNDIREAHYYKYDKNSNITEERTVNAYGSSNGADYEEIRGYSYDDLNHLVKTDITKKNPQGEVISSESNTYEYDAAGNKTRESVLSGTSVQSSTDYRFNEFNQLISSVKKDEEGSAVSSKAYTYDLNGNQTKEIDSITGEEADYKYDADNRLSEATGRTGETVDYEQDNKYNGFGQRIRKKEGSDETNYFYDGTAVLYTEDGNGETTTFNLIGTEDNILFTARPAEEEETSFYSYTKDLRESTINLIGSDGSSVRSYSYDDFGETKVMGSGDFCNEVCYGAGIYDDTTGLYYLNARYYDPDTGNFLTQDTYRGSRSRTETLNLYGYCAGNPINYTDPSGHWIWGIIGAASGAYDGYKYAKKKKYKGWRKAAAIAGGAALGAVNPFKVFKAARTGYRAYKACKYAKKARSYVKKGKALKKIKLKARHTKITKKKYKVKRKPKVVMTSKKTIKKLQRKAKARCFTAGTRIHTEKGFKAIETIKPGDRVWSENPETNSKALKKVKKIFVREKDSLIRLAINGEVIETTDEHPFYVEGRGFTAAKELKIGDEVRLEDGTAARIESSETRQLDRPVKVYNFEVEDYHTYYVSEQKVLVHNTCSKPTNRKQLAKPAVSEKQVPNKGFNSFSELKNYIGDTGEGNAWHHIVEQSQIEKSGFTPESIHNVNNIIAIPHGKGSVHAKITGHYNSKQIYTGDQTVRDWLSGKSFSEQFDYGMNQLKKYGDVTSTENVYMFRQFRH